MAGDVTSPLAEGGQYDLDAGDDPPFGRPSLVTAEGGGGRMGKPLPVLQLCGPSLVGLVAVRRRDLLRQRR